MTTKFGASRAQFQIYSLGVTGCVRWRLLGRNNRDLGRGADEYSDVDAARAGITQTQRTLDTLERSVVRVNGSGWIWRLGLDGRTLVSSTHAFDRRIRCVCACQLFVELASDADIRDGLLMSTWNAEAPLVG
jgi:hypothetical protein